MPKPIVCPPHIWHIKTIQTHFNHKLPPVLILTYQLPNFTKSWHFLEHLKLALLHKQNSWINMPSNITLKLIQSLPSPKSLRLMYFIWKSILFASFDPTHQNVKTVPIAPHQALMPFPNDPKIMLEYLSQPCLSPALTFTIGCPCSKIPQKPWHEMWKPCPMSLTSQTPFLHLTYILHDLSKPWEWAQNLPIIDPSPNPSYFQNCQKS